MKHLINLLLLVLSGLTIARADHPKPIKDFILDDYAVFTIPVSANRVTTISFPGPISAIEAAQVTVDGRIPGLFQIAHTQGSHFLSVRALVKQAATNLNIRWNNKTYVLELVESDKPLYSVIFQLPPDIPERRERITVTPTRLLALLDKAKAYPLLKQNHPEAVGQVEYVHYPPNLQIMDYRSYEVEIEEAFRFNPEDTLVFRLLLRNKTDQPVHYRPDGFSLRVGERAYPQSISDASGIIPPEGESSAYFAVTGTPTGGRNDISLKNDFIVILDAAPVESREEPQP